MITLSSTSKETVCWQWPRSKSIKIHFHTNEPWKVLEYRYTGEDDDIVVEDGPSVADLKGEPQAFSKVIKNFPLQTKQKDSEN